MFARPSYLLYVSKYSMYLCQCLELHNALAQATRNGIMKRNKEKADVIYWLRDFCISTSQHGYKYIALPGQSITERVLWGIVLLIGICAAVSMVCIEWGRNDTSPTLIALDTAHYPIWNTDFPAVTICGINRIRRSEALKFSKEWLLPKGTTRKEVLHGLLLLSQLIDMEECNITALRRLQSVLELNNITASDVLRTVMHPCEDLVLRCRFKGTNVDCKELFQVSNTPYGYCCSFNYHGNKLKNNEATESPSGKEDPYRAYRSSACGFQMGLTVLIDNKIDEYYDTSLASYGVKVLLHDPFDYPSDSTDERVLSAGSIMMASVYPETFQNTPAVLYVGLRQRKCQLRNERRLQNLKRYSYNNCYAECRSNYSTRTCGCSPFFYPNVAGQRICNLTDVPCLKEHRTVILEMGQEFDNNSEYEAIPDKTSRNHNPCNCLPGCSQIFYRLETSDGDVNTNDLMLVNSQKLFEDVKLGPQHSLLHVYFIDLVGTRYMRNMYYTWHQLLASIGGILSLFLGFSLMSVVEILYFYTIRIYCTVRRQAVLSHEEKIPTVKSAGTVKHFTVSPPRAKTPGNSTLYKDASNRNIRLHLYPNNLYNN
ncbi:sodium channel protein Nach-like [Periplaneta americana]|uniref:sodium channel protein Nach-like n=1 Tax=Periplaneta americana TaxID=6978 RepID=UPI0037E756EF